MHLSLGMGRTAKCWDGEFLEAQYVPSGSLVHVVQEVSTRQQPGKRTALELFIPRGGYAAYGLLGGEFIPDGSGTLTIRVLISDSHGELCSWALAASMDTVHVGLPQEFARAVMDGALARQAPSSGLSSGTLIFDRAAHGDVGSNPNLFAKLAGLVMELLEPDMENAPASALAERIRSSL